MTTSTDTTAETATVEGQGASLADLVQRELPVLDFVHPDDLLIGDNIRDEAEAEPIQLSREFLRSLAKRGNVSAIITYRREDGVLVVVDGQMRTLGLRKINATEAKVEIHPSLASAQSEAEREAERIAVQWVSNEHRHQLTKRQRLGAIEQMFNLGLSATRVADELAIPRPEARAVKRIMRSDSARTAALEGQLTLEQAAALTEFEDEEEIDALMRAARWGSFDQVATQFRDRRDERARRAAVAPEWTARGFTVLDQKPGYGTTAEYTPLHYLSRADDAGDITAADITAGEHWAVWLEEVEEWRTISTGEPVNDDTDVDWSVADEPDTQPADGLLHPDTVEMVIVWEPAYYCTDIEAAGLHSRYNAVGTNTRTATGEDPAEVEARKERERVQRSVTKKCNRASRRATVHRREWLAKYLRGRKTGPKTSPLWVARLLAANPDLLTENQAAHLTEKLLGAKPSTLLADDDATDSRAAAVMLGVAAGAIEARMHPNADRSHYWRNRDNSPGQYGYVSDTAQMVQYLELLAAIGYELQDIDRYVIGEITLEEFTVSETAVQEAEKATKP